MQIADMICGNFKTEETSSSPHRPFSASELRRREQLLAYLDAASEDAMIEEVLLPLFRQLGFHRVTATGLQRQIT